MIVVSPWAKTNYVDHNLSDQSSIINFIEYNWHLPAIFGSFDQALASVDATEGVPFDLAGMFDFTHPSSVPTFPLDPATGQFDLRGASVHGQDLSSQNLSGAEASGADFHGVNLKGAFLANIDLSGASLQGTNLLGADLTGANLAGAVLSGANVHGIIWNDTTCPDGSNSNGDGGTCEGHASLSQARTTSGLGDTRASPTVVRGSAVK
jgi:uncharacterized protein YjbI with pentapeptide repeats